jgi:multicomponent Na+:H+ antiporter subunit G
MTETIGVIFIAVGLAFDLLGCLGLIRMPDVYNRLQASTKCVTFGTCSIMFGTFLFLGLCAAGVKALLCVLFVALTAPVSAHALARAAHISGVRLCEGSVVDRYAEKRGSGAQEKSQS